MQCIVARSIVCARHNQPSFPLQRARWSASALVLGDVSLSQSMTASRHLLGQQDHQRVLSLHRRFRRSRPCRQLLTAVDVELRTSCRKDKGHFKFPLPTVRSSMKPLFGSRRPNGTAGTCGASRKRLLSMGGVAPTGLHLIQSPTD